MRLQKSIANRARRRSPAENRDLLQKKIRDAPTGPQTAAFFDMDQTLVAANSSLLYVQRAFAEDRAAMSDLFKTVYYYLLYRLNRLSVDAVLKPTLSGIRTQDEAQFAAFCRQIALKELVPRVAAQAKLVLAAHRQQGHRCVLLTAATCYLADPLAKALAMDATLCTRLEVEDGLFTGRLTEGGLCYGVGKVKAARAYSAREQVDLDQSFFYTDSASDLPLLNIIGVPVVVNPDWALRRWSRRRGWLSCRWPQRDRD